MITHVRNLDFKPVDKMKKLIYEQVMVKDGKEIAIAPGMAPFTGIFTGHKTGSFSISYNVREKLPEGPARDHEIMQNLHRMLDSDFYLQSHFMETLMLTTDSFAEAVELVSTTQMTSPSHFILGGLEQNEGVVVSRDFDKPADIRWLSDEDWFVVQTNSDVWTSPDSRFLKATELMQDLGQS